MLKGTFVRACFVNLNLKREGELSGSTLQLCPRGQSWKKRPSVQLVWYHVKLLWAQEYIKKIKENKISFSTQLCKIDTLGGVFLVV